MEKSIKRHLKNEVLDDVDHALGRPEFALGETYRSHFECASIAEANEKEATGFWICNGEFCHVTQLGRQALHRYLITEQSNA